jgi:hypothetical protein
MDVHCSVFLQDVLCKLHHHPALCCLNECLNKIIIFSWRILIRSWGNNFWGLEMWKLVGGSSHSSLSEWSLPSFWSFRANISHSPDSWSAHTHTCACMHTHTCAHTSALHTHTQHITPHRTTHCTTPHTAHPTSYHTSHYTPQHIAPLTSSHTTCHQTTHHHMPQHTPHHTTPHHICNL